MILIVDSDHISDIKAKQIFEALGYSSIMLANTANQARNILNSSDDSNGKNNITLIVINSVLKDGDGFSLCREIRKIKAVRNVYIILLISSYENKTAIEKTHHSGADDFAVKPYDSTGFFKHFAGYVISKTVLLIEDDPLIRQLVCAILYKYEVEVIEVDDGIEAHNIINSILPVCLVLLDIGLPGMNGVQLLSGIRSKPCWKKTPVVMLTSSTDSTNVKDSLSGGANDYIVKPFKVDGFEKRVACYFKQVKK